MTKKHTGYVLLACSALFSLSLATGTWAADVNKLVESCAACHGKGGASPEAAFPNVGGFSAAYMTGALTLYKNKERPSQLMFQAVKDLSNADIKQIAEYFAGQKFVRASQKFDPVLAKKGKDIHEQSCEKCHSENGSVAGDDAGILAGQKMAYLAEQFKLFSEGKRPIPKMMRPKFEKLDKAGIDALINYYGSFK
ncbi:MAG: c-type cytochrome [Sulfuricella sp.]